MKAYIFSIGEPTVAMCEWSLKRQGFEVVIVHNPNTSLWSKLKWVYNHEKEDFLRVDGDIICNLNIKKLEPQDNCWWHCSLGYDWYLQDINAISIHWIKKQAIPYLRENVDRFENSERPETELSRIEEFQHPRRYETYNLMCGLHGFNQKDIDRVRETKERRGQDYDFELVRMIGR